MGKKTGDECVSSEKKNELAGIKPKKKKKLWIVILFVVIILLLSIFLLFVYKWREKKEKFVADFVDNSSIVIRYDDFQSLEQLNDNRMYDEIIKGLSNYISVFSSSGSSFRAEEITGDLYVVGSVYVPRDIESDKLEDILLFLSKACQDRYLSTTQYDKEDLFIRSESEDDLSKIDFCDYTDYEYTQKILVFRYDEEKDVLTNENTIIEKADIFFY